MEKLPKSLAKVVLIHPTALWLLVAYDACNTCTYNHYPTIGTEKCLEIVVVVVGEV